MDKLTATILNLLVAGLITYFGGNAFLSSGSPMAATVQAMHLTLHLRWVTFTLCYIGLSWAPLIAGRLLPSNRG